MRSPPPLPGALLSSQLGELNSPECPIPNCLLPVAKVSLVVFIVSVLVTGGLCVWQANRYVLFCDKS